MSFLSTGPRGPYHGRVLLSVSVSHKTADFDLLDRLSAATADATAAELFRGGPTAGGVFLSTCNRVEAYADVPPGAEDVVAEQLIRRLATDSGIPADDLRRVAILSTDGDALRHLFSVTAGLESLAVGEDEIAGQVRRAYDTSRSAGTTTPELDRAFQRAAKVSREVRNAADLGQAGRSLVQLALDLAGHRVTDWRAARVLVVGTGNYAAAAIAALDRLGVTDIAVYSATGRAEDFARKYRVRAEHDLTAAIAMAEIVITCTARYTVSTAHVPDSSRRLVIDLGLPRNVDAEVGLLPGVELLDLELLARHAQLPEFSRRDMADDMIVSAAGQHLAEQTAAPAIVALRRHVFDVLDAEIERITASSESEAQAARTIEALRHFAGVMLHEPSIRARSLAEADRIAEFEAGLAIIFGVEPWSVDAAPVQPMRRDSDLGGVAGSTRISRPDASA